MPIRTLIVDDHGIVRTGIRQLLQTEADIAVVGEAGGVKEAVRKAVELQPDIVLMDITLADGSGIEATQQIKERCPKTQVLILTVYDDQDTVLKAVQVGAVGYVLKDLPPEYLAGAIRSIHSGRTIINPAIARKMVERLASTEHEILINSMRKGPGLTEREIEVLKGVAQGLSDKELALKLFLSEPTIKSHLRSIYQKLSLKNRAQATAYAIRHGLSV